MQDLCGNLLNFIATSKQAALRSFADGTRILETAGDTSDILEVWTITEHRVVTPTSSVATTSAVSHPSLSVTAKTTVLTVPTSGTVALILLATVTRSFRYIFLFYSLLSFSSLYAYEYFQMLHEWWNNVIITLFTKNTGWI